MTNPETLPTPSTEPEITPTAEPVAEATAPAPQPEAEPEIAPAVVAAPVVAEPIAEAEPEVSFAELFAEFEAIHKRPRATDDSPRQLEGTIISITDELVLIDIGYKIEGAIPRAEFKTEPTLGDKFPVSIKGRTEDGYYALSRFKVVVPIDFTALEAAFNSKTPITANVTGLVKGGLTVDVGMRGFLPASRSGTRDAAELEKLVGTEITVLITKLDIAEEDCVVDRRTILEQQALVQRAGRYAALNVGDRVKGTVRSLMAYGAFVDLDGIDGLLHVSDISWTRVNSPADLLTVGQQVEVVVLKIDAETNRISLGLKQLTAEPWDSVPANYVLGQRVKGTVTRLADFGAFVEIAPGIEGLIHISEMSWTTKLRKPSDLLKVGDEVDAVILGIKPEEKRLSLGLKQALQNPWSDLAARFPVGSQVTGPVVRLAPFGAFVQIEEGIEGLVHISEIVPDKRINHPQEVLRTGEVVKALVLAIDSEKRQVKLSIKQLIPTSLDEFLAAHNLGEEISGRVVSETTVELGEGVFATAHAKATPVEAAPTETAAPAGKVDLSALTSKLQSRWKGQDKTAPKGDESLRAGQIRSFRITLLDLENKKIEVEAV